MKVELLVEKNNKKHTVVELLQEEKQKTKFGLKNNPIPPYYSVQCECDLQKWILSPLTVQVYIKRWLTEDHSEGHRYIEEHEKNEI